MSFIKMQKFLFFWALFCKIVLFDSNRQLYIKITEFFDCNFSAGDI